MATGTKLMKEISDQFLVCKVCLEPFKEPKTLACLHTFCLGCIQQQYDAESNRPTRYALYMRSVTCPLCRKKTELPTGGVRRLPDNFLVSNLTEVLAKRCISKVPPCEICHTVQRARSNDACSKCLDCDKLLCRACVELHASTKVTQDHGLIDIEGQKDIECKEHPEETVRFYCERCDACICVVCTFQEHQDHDVCSFSDGFAKHKVTLESLLGKSKERLTGVAKRLKVIEKYETLSRELKERIRDLAISYTSQVRAREKELIKKVDDLLGGAEGVSQLTENKQFLQESLDNLQSACNLTEIVMKDKGVEMLLLKREIQGKLNSLLQSNLPPEPPDIEEQLDLRFVPGEVRLGEVLLPGEVVEEEEKKERKREGQGNGECGRWKNGVVQNGMEAEKKSNIPFKGPAVQNGTCSECKDCQERKRKEEEEDKMRRKRRSASMDRETGGEKKGRVGTKSVYIQTKARDIPPPYDEDEDVADGGSVRERSSSRRRRKNGHFTTTSSQVSLTSNAGVTVANSAMQTTTATVSSRFAATESAGSRTAAITDSGVALSESADSITSTTNAATTHNVPKGMRTLKIQTDDSCLRDAHLTNVASSSGGGTYPFTGAAIAAAFLRHTRDLDDVMSTSQTSSTYSSGQGGVEVTKETQDAEVATDVSLGLSSSVSDFVAALSQAGGEGGMSGPPDLLAQTNSNPSSAAASWIRSRKVQTEISAMAEDTHKPGKDGKLVSDEEFNKSLFGGAAPAIAGSRNTAGKQTKNSASPLSSPALERARAARVAARAAAVTKKDVGIMTPFDVRIVPASSNKQTSPEVVSTRSVELMTAPDTRSLYIQTRGPRVTSTGMGTDREGQMSKSTSTLSVTTVDSETAMPQVTQESCMTWTEAVATSERATATEAQKTADAATLTAVRKTSEFGAQMRPQGVSACTNTAPPHRTSQPTQTSPPGTASKATMPDPALLTPQLSIDDSTSTNATPPISAASSPSQSPRTSHRLSLASLTIPAALANPSPLSLSRGGSVSSLGSAADVCRADKATETVTTAPKLTTRAVGPSVVMEAGRCVSTDTLNLTQYWDRETCTPQIKTIDEWTHTPQPQMINTGVTPPRPSTLEAGVATNPLTLMDQATYTEVKTLRESATETCTVVCDSETLTEKLQQCDAQTEAEPPSEDKGTDMELEDGMVDEEEEEGKKKRGEEEEEEDKKKKESKDSESQCLPPTLVSREINTTRVRKKAKEIQTPFSYVECQMCQHPEQLQQQQEMLEKAAAAGSGNKTFTDTSTDPSPPDTHDVATMALSCLSSNSGVVDMGVQTSEASLYDKGVATSFEWDDDFIPPPRPFFGLECQDAATSTESLPYIGLLSEIDVDELIVIPEAHFQLVSSDYDSDAESIVMVDNETWMDDMDFVEQGTQTLVIPPAGNAEPTPPGLIEAVREVCSKNLVSIGTNTLPKVTFEKETSTPIRHLFSKGTMTFYVAKMDKATSTISHTRNVAERYGGACPGINGGVVREARPSHKDNKVTMTSKKEKCDMAVETDATPLDGRITQCISKLRNLSERLNSPTLRKTSEGEIFFPPSPTNSSSGKLADSSKDDITSKVTDTSKDPIISFPSSASRPPGFPKLATGEAVMNLIRAGPTNAERSVEEEQRQKQLHSLLAETDAVLRSKDPSPVRKAQPITTLKPRTPVVIPASPEGTSGGEGEGETRSLPRQRSLDRQKVKMGSGQPTSPSRLPLLRYNSAPGRIATVPTQTLLNRMAGGTLSVTPEDMTSAPGVPPPKESSPSGNTASSDSGPDSDTHSTSSQKVQQRPGLPSISETRTSSCSDSSFISQESTNLDVSSSSPQPASLLTSMTSTHSRTPSNVTSVSEAGSDVRADGGDKDDSDGVGDDSSSVSSASTTLTFPPAGDGGSPGKQKKEKKGFMQRLLSVKKKKDADKEKDKEKKKEEERKKEEEKHSKQATTKQPPPPSPKVQPKQPPTVKQPPPTSPKPPKKQSAPAPAQGTAPLPAQPAQHKAEQQKQPPQQQQQQGQQLQQAQQQSLPQGAKPKTTTKPTPKPATPSTTAAPASAQPERAAAPPAGKSLPPASAHIAVPPAAGSRPSSSDSSHSKPIVAPNASPPMAPHHYPPLPDPNQAPQPPRKPRPFVYVRQRLMPIQQDNVEEVIEKKEKEKEEKGKKEPGDPEEETLEDDGEEKNAEKDPSSAEKEGKMLEAKVTVKAELQPKVRDPAKVKVTEKPKATLASSRREKLASASREKPSASVSRERLASSVSKEKLDSKAKETKPVSDKVKGAKEGKVTAEKAKGVSKVARKVEKEKAERGKDAKTEGRTRTPRDWICGK